jgi:hypothetical protein
MNGKRKQRKQPKRSGTVDSFRKRLFSGRKVNPKHIFHELHAFRSFQEMESAARCIEHPDNFYHRYIYGVPFAQNYSDVRSTRFSVFTGNIGRDLDWFCLSIARYSKELSVAIKIVEDFNKAFLVGNYAKAKLELATMVSKVGLSLWGIEKGFLLAEYADGLEKNKNILSEIFEAPNNDDILNYLSVYLSLRCEAKMSVDNYRARLNKALENLNDEFEEVKSYFRYRLDNDGIDLLAVGPNITYFEGPSPVFDRYLTFLSLVQTCAIGGPEYRKVAMTCIKRIEGRIIDDRVDALCHYFDPTLAVQYSELGATVFEILNCYTEGDYIHSAKKSAEVLMNYPDLYELYYIYVRSVDYSGQAFLQIFPKDSLAAAILEHSNILFRASNTWRLSADQLLKYNLILWRDPLAHHLMDTYAQETSASPEGHFRRLSLLNGLLINPRFATIYDDSQEAEAFINRLSEKFGNGSSLALFKYATGKDLEDSEISGRVPETRKRIYASKRHRALGLSVKAISTLRPLYQELSEKLLPGGGHLLDRVTKELFWCYLDNRDFSECVDLVVHSYMRDPSYITKMPVQILVKAIEEHLPPDIMRKITYPLLYACIDAKPRALYVAYDNFLSSLGVVRPTQLIEIADHFSEKELHCFLANVCIPEVLACSYHFTGTIDVEGERIKVCQFLSASDSSNAKLYSDEISAITSKSIIREGMRQIEVSKIYADEAGIRLSGRKVLEESFSRYRELASMTSLQALKMLNMDTLHLYQLTQDGNLVRKPISRAELEESAPRKRIALTSHFMLFSELFLEIRDRFISSGEHGLDGYLSVRVRHGVLQNQIRSIFEALHLISEKDTNTGEYLPNSYWESRFVDITENQRSEIQGHLGAFSRKVDDVSQRLNREMIQVKTEKKNPNALFDYSFGTAELFQLFESEFVHITDFEAFMDAVFRVLWSRTLKNLELIRKIVSTDIKDTIHKSIGLLDKDVRGCIGPGAAVELFQSIARAQTNLQYSLESVSQWFTISRSRLIQRFSMDNLLNICIKSLKNIYPHKLVSPAIKASGEMDIDGRFFAPFFDILRTILDNAIVHSGLPAERIGLEIDYCIVEFYLSMKISNNLSAEVRGSDPVSCIKESACSLMGSGLSGIIAKEGRSGLMKVRKIIGVDLLRDSYILDFGYHENGKFVVSLGMSLEGLLYENANH